MNKIHIRNTGDMGHSGTHVHEWEMISGFGLSVAKNPEKQNDCVLVPIGEALRPLGISDQLLCQMSMEVKQAGEMLRSNCPEGTLDCINVRIQVNSQALRKAGSENRDWSYYLIKQIASGEPDTIEDPHCYIDLHVYQAP